MRSISHVVTFPGGDKGVRLPSNYGVDENTGVHFHC